MIKKLLRFPVVSLVLIAMACTDMGEPEILLPQIELEVSTVNFSTQTIGTIQTREFYIANLGEGELNGEISLIQDSTAFTLPLQGPFILTSNDTLFVEMSFSPVSALAYTASIIVTSDDPENSEQTIQVGGSGTEELVPVIAFSSNQINFGTIASDAAVQQQFTIYNTGTDTLTISALSIDLSEYLIDKTAPIALAPSDSQNIGVTFTPVVAGTFNAQLSITSNSSSSPHQVVISGAAEDIIGYAAQVQPIWDASCTGCHGSGATAGLNLTSYTNMMSGGNSGAVVIPNDATSSKIVQKLKGTAGGDRMPQGGTFLSETTINLVETWINQGAQDN